MADLCLKTGNLSSDESKKNGIEDSDFSGEPIYSFQALIKGKVLPEVFFFNAILG
jgi:hypothetical protein